MYRTLKYQMYHIPIHLACTLIVWHYTPCMYTIHPACTLYTLHAHYTPCMYTIHPACTLYTLHVHYPPVNVHYTPANEIPSTTHVDQLNNIVIFLRNTINARIAIYMWFPYYINFEVRRRSSNKIYSNIVKSTSKSASAYESYIISNPTTVIEYITSKVRNLTYK